MSKRKQHHPEFKARGALEALKGEDTGITGQLPDDVQAMNLNVGLDVSPSSATNKINALAGNG